MSFDGLPRPAQFNLKSDVMNPYRAANAARTDNDAKPLIKAPGKDDEIQAVHRDHREYPQDEEEKRKEPFSEEEAEQLALFAKMRGIMDFSLETGEDYEFTINPETGLVDLVAKSTGAVVLTLQPDELIQLSGKIHRYAGMLTDRSG